VRADVAIVGGGPAGLAAAIGAARRGLGVVVLEKGGWPRDKACGEGLMPSGLRALDRLGVRTLLDPAECAPFEGVRYVQEDGSFAEARFSPSSGGGLGIRRSALSDALARRARELGVTLRAGTTVQRLQQISDGIELHLDGQDALAAKLVIAADGLASPRRHAAGLDAPARGPRRFGLRQHFRCAAWSPFVEVHFSNGLEAYVTPAGAHRVGVAFLWDAGTARQSISFASLLDCFPGLRARLAGVPPDSEPRGAGPLLRQARARTADRLALIGDAGGYVDAITGEGLSLAFHCAEALTAILPDAIACGAARETLRAYEREFARAFRRYSLLARGLLALSRRPSLRKRVIRLLGRSPRLFGALFHWVTREHALPAAEFPPEKLLCAG
jgi:flavin-dependent dehydrogenase